MTVVCVVGLSLSSPELVIVSFCCSGYYLLKRLPKLVPFLIVVRLSGDNTEFSVVRKRATVKSLAVAIMSASIVICGILSLCGIHFTICALFVLSIF